MWLTTTTQKDNNKNNTTKEYPQKKFVGGNSNLSGKIFDVSSKDAIHQFAKTLKAIADYVGRQYTHRGDIHFMIENLTDHNSICPGNPEDEDDQFEMESWKKQLDIYRERKGIYSDNKMKLYSLFCGQSTKLTQSKLKTHQEFQQCKTNYDSLKLIKIIWELSSRLMTDSINIKQRIKPNKIIIIWGRHQRWAVKSILREWGMMRTLYKA